MVNASCVSRTNLTSILHIREEAYGSLIYAYALSNQLDCARTLLLSMESGELGVRPGPKCYDGFILACIRSRAWEDAISTYKKMDESGLIPSPAACHGIVLAAFRTGGRSEVKAHLERFSASGAQLHGDGALLAVKTMLPTMADIGVTMSSIRDHLRGVGEKESSLQFERLNLVRSLRVAELETQRQPSPNLKIDVLQKRRRVAWQNALKDLITYANAVEAEEQASHS